MFKNQKKYILNKVLKGIGMVNFCAALRSARVMRAQNLTHFYNSLMIPSQKKLFHDIFLKNAQLRKKFAMRKMRVFFMSKKICARKTRNSSAQKITRKTAHFAQRASAKAGARAKFYHPYKASHPKSVSQNTIRMKIPRPPLLL